MGSHQGATFQGYVHSTRDALLIFEGVRRGMLPKITRRLRDDERKQIASGTIFVFDEVESSIKRWTDGMIWSPSRILNNFLVYREVEKKDPKPSPDQPAFATNSTAYGMPTMPNSSGGSNVNFQAQVRNVPLTLMPNAMDADAQMMHYKQEHNAYQGLDNVPSSSNGVYADHDTFFGHPSHPQHSAHPQSHPQAAGLVGVMDDHAGPSITAKREVELDRTIVGSLTSSYPFVRDGLCKKTISIQVEGSTQHLISYYKIDDVHNSRLTIPSTLPELSSLSISPIFLNKANFRYPPIVEIGPDGVPRYVGESTDNAMRASGHVSSGNESFSSSEARQDGMGRPASRSLSIYSPGLPSDASHGEMHTHRYPHQIGGDGMLPASAAPPSSSSSIPYRNRRSSDAPRRRANSRFEPYHPPAPMTFGHGMAAHSLYSNSPAMDNGPISPSGRRAFFSGTRSYSDMEPGAPYSAEHGAFGLPRQQDDGFLGVAHVGQASNANGGPHASHMDQQHPSMETLDTHGSFQHSFPSGSMMPMVPSQPTRSDVSWNKQEQQDPFHFSSRLARGSWDSNQPNHSTSFVHNLQQPPATSQGLTALPIHSQSSMMASSSYPRFAGSPPNTGSSHDSRHSYAASTGRIEEYVEGVHPPTATRLEDTVHYSSRPISRAGETGYANDLDAAGVVKTGGLEALHVRSDPASPYPRPQQQQQAQQQVSASDAAAFDSYGRASGAVEAQQSYYAQPPSHAEASHDSLQLDQQAFGRHAAAYPASHDVGNASARNGHTSWTSTPAGEGNGAVSSRPGTSHDQGYHRQFRTDASDAGAADDSGFEKVMLTRPAPP